jgi:hypothetical protein
MVGQISLISRGSRRHRRSSSRLIKAMIWVGAVGVGVGAVVGSTVGGGSVGGATVGGTSVGEGVGVEQTQAVKDRTMTRPSPNLYDSFILNLLAWL